MIRVVKVPQITTVGTDTNAVGTDYTPIPIVGKILSINIDYSAGQAVGTIVTITTVKAPVRTILTRTASATDGWFSPRMPLHDAAAAAVLYAATFPIYEPFPVADIIKVAVTAADSAETVDVTIVYEE